MKFTDGKQGSKSMDAVPQQTEKEEIAAGASCSMEEGCISCSD